MQFPLPNLLSATANWKQAMTITMEDQSTIRSHKGKGIVSSIIGVTCTVVLILVFTLDITAMMPKQLHGLSMTIGAGTLFGSVVGTALGLFGALDRSSKKLYPVIGLCLNIGILALFVGTAIFGLLMDHSRPR